MTDAWRSVGEVVGDIERRVARDGDWEISPWPGELFASADGAGAISFWSQRGVSVHASATEFSDGDRGLVRRANRGALRATTRISLRWVYQVSIDDGSDPYRAALDAEADLITRAMTPAPDGSPVRVLVDSAQREITEDAHVIGEVRLSVTHHMPLVK